MGGSAGKAEMKEKQHVSKKRDVGGRKEQIGSSEAGVVVEVGCGWIEEYVGPAAIHCISSGEG